ncbi:protein amalgam-like [Neocloeon triangulifer]|uniref:protein amalgam-like n=1 Tax=Neocloeon triangulifer TaxID=2078957 RepID=UPI00286F2496|nr:protein amalgam-like [Neocloeon triangulifer]
MGLKQSWAVFLVGCIFLLAQPLDCRQQSQGPPFIKGVPVTVRDRENATVSIPCVVENLGASTLRWLKGEELIVERTAVDTDPVVSPNDPRISVWPDNSLQVKNLRESDDGEYTCQVARLPPLKSIQRTNAILVLYPPTVHLNPDVEEFEVELNSIVSIECVADGVPKPIISWTEYGGAVLTPDELKMLGTVPKVEFRATTRHAAGRFTCVANNGVGEPVSASTRLKILYPPEVTMEREWVHTGHGAKSELTCRVNAEPEAKVEWLRPDGEIFSPYSNPRFAISVLGTRNTLIIRSVRDSDLGKYKCMAENIMGKGSATLELTGLCNPVKIKEKLGLAMDLSYSIIWEVDCYSQVYDYLLKFKKTTDIEWYNLTIPSASSHTYTAVYSQDYNLSGLEPSTEYQVQIQARNKYGLGRPSKIFSFTTLGYGQAPTEPINQEELEVIEKEEVIEQVHVTVVKTAVFATTSAGTTVEKIPIIFVLIVFFNVFVKVC